MTTKLFVGSLAFSVNDDALKELFDTVGTVRSAKVIIDRYSNQSKGIGFVEMGTVEEARNAIEKLHGCELQGRTIVVSEARPQEPRERRPFNGGDRGGFGGGDRGGFGGNRGGFGGGDRRSHGGEDRNRGGRY